MSDDIHLFGVAHQTDDGTVRLQLTLTVHQARRLETLVPEAITVQEAIRMGLAQSLRDREKLSSRSDVGDVVDALQRIDRRLAEHEKGD